jgi:hypothetical protein
MAKPELDPNWWQKNAPKSIAGGAAQHALAEVAKHGGGHAEKMTNPKDFFAALDHLMAAIGKDEQTANKAKDHPALAMLADLKKVHAETKAGSIGYFKRKGAAVIK